MHIAQHYPLSLKAPMCYNRSRELTFWSWMLSINIQYIAIIHHYYPIRRHYPLSSSNTLSLSIIIIHYIVIIHYHYPIHYLCPRCRTAQEDRLRTSFLPSLPPPSWIYRGEQIQNIPMWIDTRYAEVNNTKYTEVNKYKIYPSQKVKQILHPSDNFRSSYF